MKITFLLQNLKFITGFYSNELVFMFNWRRIYDFVVYYKPRC